MSAYTLMQKDGVTLTPITEIDRVTYDNLLILNEHLNFYRDFDRAWRILDINLRRQKDVMMHFKAAFDDPESHPELANPELIQRALNVELFNVLSAAYFYFSEFSNTSIIRKYGKNSEESSFLKKTLSEYFDKYLEYRFFYKLRNYAVHCGLPIQIVRRLPAISSASNSGGFAIWFDCQKLLRSYDGWGKHVTKDLNEFDKLPVNTLVINFANIAFSLQTEIDRFLRRTVSKDIIRYNILHQDLDFEKNTYSIVQASGSEHYEIDLAFSAIPRIMTDVPDFDLQDRLFDMSPYLKNN